MHKNYSSKFFEAIIQGMKDSGGSLHIFQQLAYWYCIQCGEQILMMNQAVVSAENLVNHTPSL